MVTTTKDQGNYDVSFVNAILTIDPNAREDITVENYEGTYDANSHTITVSGTIDGDKVEYSTDGNTWSSTLPTFTNVTTGSLVYVKVTNSNTTPYEIRKTGKVVINPIEVKVTADRKTTVYNQEIPELTAVVGATIDGYNVEYSLYTIAQKGSDVGEYDIVIIAEQTQGNYKVLVENNILEITPIAHEPINAISYYGEYDGKEHTITVEGLIEGDEVEYSLDKQDWTKDIPMFTEVIDGQIVYVRVTNRNTIEPVEAQATVTITQVINVEPDKKDESNVEKTSDEKYAEENTPETGDNALIYILILSLSIAGIKVSKIIKE